MKIAEVKLKKNGLEVTWEKYETKNNVSFRVEHKDKRSAPVQEDLLECFKELRSHAIAVAGYSDKQPDDCEITSIKVGSSGGLIMAGSINTINDLYMAIKTPEATPDSYDGYKQLEAILKTLFSEVKLYMETDKMMSVELFVKKQNAKNEDFNENEFNSLSQEEKLKMYTGLIEKAGGIVMMPEDISFDSEEEPVAINSTEGKIVEFTQPEPKVKKVANDDNFDL
jgi:hypothetical protein